MSDDAPMVVTAGITKAFAGAGVLDGVDLSVPAGSIVSLLGPSGSGKTTLLRIIAGLDAPDAGRVCLGGDEVTGPGRFVPPERRHVGMVFQDWALFPHLSVARNVAYGLSRSERDGPRVSSALELVGLSGLGHRMPHSLSGGQRQRVALARALAPEPSVLLLDEPFSNLDATLRTAVRSEVHRLLSTLGVTAVFVTHDQTEAFVLGDSVAVLHDGRIEQHGTPEELYARPATRWLAGFVGDANLLVGEASGSGVTTVCGTIVVDRAHVGPVEVLVRPEHLRLEPVSPTTAGDGRPVGVIDLVEYQGHTTVYDVRVAGVDVRVRAASAPVHHRGDLVAITHRGPATVAYSRQTITG